MDQFESDYEDVLQNIESAIITVYREDPSLVDFDVENALDALTRVYKAEMQDREATPPRLNPRAQAVFDSTKGMCEWRLGREAFVREEPQPEGRTEGRTERPGITSSLRRALSRSDHTGAEEPRPTEFYCPSPVSVAEIIQCLARIRRSVKLWHKEGGRQGYLRFIDPYL